MPVGGYAGVVGNPRFTPGPGWTNRGRGWYVEQLAADFPHAPASGGAVQVLADTLRSAEDSSVTLASVGHATNLVGLLESSGGYELVRRKVKELVWMGGGRRVWM